MRRTMRWAILSAVPLCMSSCLTERTVRDGEGRVIYQESEVHTPFEGEQKKLREVEQRERQLGW